MGCLALEPREVVNAIIPSFISDFPLPASQESIQSSSTVHALARSEKDGHPQLDPLDTLLRMYFRPTHNPRRLKPCVLYIPVHEGESWWETDLLAAAKDLLAATPPADPNKRTGGKKADTIPPGAVREYLIQEQVRSWLVALLSRVDPIRLIEVDLLMEKGKVRL